MFKVRRKIRAGSQKCKGTMGKTRLTKDASADYGKGNETGRRRGKQLRKVNWGVKRTVEKKGVNVRGGAFGREPAVGPKIQ